MNAPVDPHPAGPGRWKGRTCRFLLAGVLRSGIVKDAVFAGFTERGQIPDTTLTIQGTSGRVVSVSLVESHARFSD